MSVSTPSRYNTNLSKAQGMVPETLELLRLWEPGMTAVDLKALVKETGALDRATDTRLTDVVTRGFAQRYLVEDGKPAKWLKHLVQSDVNRSVLRQISLIYTARHNIILHDFITSVYWRKATSGTGEVTKSDTRDFLERAVLLGHIAPRWADSMMERVTRYLLGTLEDFQMIGENRYGRRHATPPSILGETVLFLAYELHFRQVEDRDIPRHTDWALFGLMPPAVITLLEREASKDHLQVQNAGQILRIEWKYPDMIHALNAIAH
ncbi:BrxA family protein [Prosthecobacter sp. SYSU 5D2]|uniref:BrxA family protein n=1 Tax=Prosthecobacter sp. SYSU 5D2 TaxID=3134134 RepID=UPI0031FE6C15